MEGGIGGNIIETLTYVMESWKTNFFNEKKRIFKKYLKEKKKIFIKRFKINIELESKQN